MTLKRRAVRLLDFDGLSMLRAKSGDRFMVRVAIGDRLIDVYFANPNQLERVTAVDATPGEPNPPDFDLEYGS